MTTPDPHDQSTGAILGGIAHRWQIPWLLAHHRHRVVIASFSFLAGWGSIALMGVLAVITHSPFVFPSLGPTAFLFFDRPLDPSSSPHHALIGHALAILCGYLSLGIIGVFPPHLAFSLTWSHILAVGFSLGLTAGLMVLLHASHPPACATALLITLGLITRISDVLVLLGGVIVLIGQAWIINRLAGIPYPFWTLPPSPPISPTDPLRTGR